ncbi:class I SAM-dependent methyltransferase [Nonomuraea harbinensis]|uniref:Methyltransferase domain-containing protein n=1 Tax=Nonomuraea harbinensis TaxID=1286938 RepID=A0ABW1BLX7_9ACTN|nr:class I SAM-dependent methyltransferase [Nonomuraea harbinensis]
MGVRYDEVIGLLREAYDGGAERRDAATKSAWKLAEREAFLDRLKGHGCRRLLEVGAGTGQDSAYFQENGLDVVAVDLSPAMVALCREKGVEAHAMDFLSLDFEPGSFDAVYALNCLLHVPDGDLPAVLGAIHTVMRPGGLFFLGVYGGGGLTGESTFEQDDHYPPRFFSFRDDERLQEYAREFFEIVDFHVVGTHGWRFQSLTLRRAASSPDLDQRAGGGGP